MKFKIPYYKEDRYITLMGDPIERKPRGLLSLEFMATAVFAAGLSSVSRDPSMAFAMSSIFGAAITKFSLLSESVLVDNFVRSGRSIKSDSAIDKKPETDIAKYSAIEHSFEINDHKTQSSTIAAIFAGVGAVLAGTSIALEMPEVPMLALTVFVGGTLRHARSAYRFNKLAKGEWAIVEKPKGGQEEISKNIEFEVNLPEIKRPEAVPELKPSMA